MFNELIYLTFSFVNIFTIYFYGFHKSDSSIVIIFFLINCNFINRILFL